MVQREDTSREGPVAEPGKELAMLEDLERPHPRRLKR